MDRSRNDVRPRCCSAISVSFTTISESRDPEEVRELLSEYFAVARLVVGRYGGTIEKFIGDAVMAVWGVPVSHEDDAERAVRAGRDLVAEVNALGAKVGAPEPSLRVGVVTGSVAVTLGAINEGMVAGDAVNTAARVQTAASPGTVWTDQETRSLTAAAIAYSDMGEHLLKGKAEPARLFRAEAIVAAVGGAQRVDGLEAPLTGRDVELRQVKELFHATQGDGRSRIVIVTGMPGVGKSRVGWEFEKYTDGLSDGFKWHRGRCLSYGEGVAYWAFSEMMRSRLRLLEGEDAAEVRAKVREGVAAVAQGSDEADWLRPRLEALLGVGDGSAFHRTDLFAAWTTMLDRVGGDEPVVLLFEDMQHADSGLLDLLEHVLETVRAKLFVLVLTRPELLESHPSLVSGRRATVIDLQPLTDPAMAVLIDGLVAELPERARSAIVGRSEGIPLYAVETVRSLIDRDAVVATDGRYVFVDSDHSRVDLDHLAAPTSLQTLIAARLDILSPLERRTVQDASVLGMVFRQSGLMALSDVSNYELDAALAGLVRKGVVDTEDDPRSPERGQYRFLQALVREVAYSTLARKDRRARHLAAADHLNDEEGADELAGIISQHLLDALEATPHNDAERPVLARRARLLLVFAAERAESLGSSQEAFRATMSALALGPEPEERVALLERGARTAQRSGENTRCEELATEAFAAYDGAGRSIDAARVLAVKARAASSLGRVAESRDLALEGLSRLGDSDDERMVRLDLLRGLNNALRFHDPGEHRDRAFENLRLAEEVGDPTALVSALSGLAIVCVDGGSPTAYVALMEPCIVLAREGRILDQLARSLSNLTAELYPNDLARAAALTDESVAVSRQAGDSNMTDFALTNASFTWWLAGEWDRLESELTEWLESRPTSATSAVLRLMLSQVRLARGQSFDAQTEDLPDSEDPWEQLGKDLFLAHVELARHQVPRSAAGAAAAVHHTFDTGEMLEDFEVGWAPAVELQLRAGDVDEAEALLALATPLLGGRSRPLIRGEHARLRGMLEAAKGQDPEVDLREAERVFELYGAPYLLACTRLELGRWLGAQGRGDEAAPLLTKARETFVQLRATPSIEDVDTASPAAVLASSM